MENHHNDEELMKVIELKLKARDQMKRGDPNGFAVRVAAELPMQRCAMCRIEFRGHGNNAVPVVDGVVCDGCNVTVACQRVLRL